MAPARSSTRHQPVDSDQNFDNDLELFIDPMLGSPLAIYIEKDVADKDTISELIVKHGGTISPGYSGVPYILVDPQKSSGQNLWRQYAGKKGKLVLDARWVHECIKAGQLQTVHSNWAGCKVTGNESLTPALPPPPTPVELQSMQPSMQNLAQGQGQGQGSGHVTRKRMREEQVARQLQPPPPPAAPQPIQAHPEQGMAPIPTVESLVHAQAFNYPVYPAPMHPPPRDLHPAAPQQAWPGPGSIAPQQTHITQPPHPQMLSRSPAYPGREGNGWNEYDHTAHGGHAMAAPATYDYSYLANQAQFYDPGAYDHTQYEQQAAYMSDPTTAAPPEANAIAEPATPIQDDAGKDPRGRKRVRGQSTPATPASALVVNRNPPARSPTPPTRVIKSTYGGNLFTAEDVMYLKKYIDYCQEQGLVLSLREICERIAIKAPHHTFYSWRRYCNKHQIRLGGYVMNPDRSESPSMAGDQDMDEEEEAMHGAADGMHANAGQQHMGSSSTQRNRSPTPPRALYRSTTGKGVAFTREDVRFLTRFMDYRKSQGRLDMVAFWKEVATKAPHHSRASWMKYWRRHKHELNRSEGDEPLPEPPDKKMRYSREDDILLANFFLTKPEGTSDKVFQHFGRINPHHPWKGWQEHHRIHKAKIEHLMHLIATGQDISMPDVPGET